MLEEQKYNVVYAGAVLIGFDENQVKNGFVSKMNIPQDKVDKLFSGKSVVLKKSLNKQKAESWRKRLLGIGAETAVIPFVSTNEAHKIEPKRIKAAKSAAKPKPKAEPKIQLASQQEYDEEMNVKILNAKAMIASQQIEQQPGKDKESNLGKKLLLLSSVLGLLIVILYFYANTMG